MRKWPLVVAPTALVLALALWTALVAFSLWTQRAQLDQSAIALAKIDAIANLRKDMAIRKWAETLGGVYVNEDKMPNLDSFETQEHLAHTRAGGETLKLVSITPIHILLAIQEISHQIYGNRERLTSLQLRNRANAPDEWESAALKSLQGGAEVAVETMPRQAGGHGLLRLMIPMKMEKECLECHRDTLVPVGGLRGGASIAIDLNTYRTAQEPAWKAIQYWHLVIWLLGLATIYAFWFFSRRRTAEQLKQEQDRRENETAFAAMAEGAVITDAQGSIRWVNDAFCSIYGYQRDEVLGRNPRILKSGRHDADFYAGFWRQLLQAGHWRGEVWNRRKTGEVFPVELSIQALRGPKGHIQRFISVFSDISERKRNEEALQSQRRQLEESEGRLRDLAGFLQTVREEERTRIARELHDEMGQALTALRIDLGWLRSKSASLGAATTERVGSALGVVEQSIVSLRRISEDLRPAMLDSLGIAAAVEHHVGQFSQRTGIPCQFTKDREEFDLDSDLSTTVFRVVQEALTNVARHASASAASVQLSQAEDGISLNISDNGRGFSGASDRKTFGLLGMRERIAMLGGCLEIDSEPGHGTHIVAWLPTKKAAST
jgi:PAS domain S-box-containing protein